jgi:hypothetical protein
VAARNLKRLAGIAREQLLHIIGVLRVTNSITKKDHATFKVADLPGMQKPVGGYQR